MKSKAGMPPFSPPADDPVRGAVSQLQTARELLRAWRGSRVLGAHRLLEALRRELGSDEAVGTLLLRAADEELPCEQRAAAKLLPRAVEALAELAQQTMLGLECLEGFRLVRNTDGLAVHYRHTGDGVHTARFESDMESPVEQILSLAREWDLVSSWNKFVSESLVLHLLSPAELWVYGSVWMPFPFSSRDVLMHCTGMDLLEEEGCYLIACFSDDVEQCPEAKGAVPPGAALRSRVDNLRGTCIKMVPLPPSTPGGPLRSHVTVLVHNNPHLPYVPQLLVDFGLHVLSPFVYSQVRRLLSENFVKSAGPRPYLQRLRAAPEMYETLRVRTQQLLDGSLTAGGADLGAHTTSEADGGPDKVVEVVLGSLQSSRERLLARAASGAAVGGGVSPSAALSGFHEGREPDASSAVPLGHAQGKGRMTTRRLPRVLLLLTALVVAACVLYYASVMYHVHSGL